MQTNMLFFYFLSDLVVMEIMDIFANINDGSNWFILMIKTVLDLQICGVSRLSERYVLLRLTHEERLPQMLPGQFVEVRIDGSSTTFLRRPISIHFYDEQSNQMWLLVAGVGEGTRKLFELKEGDRLNCMFPLGHGFSMPLTSEERLLLIGGGVGIAPLLFMGKEMLKFGCRPTFLLGARSKSDLLQLSEFEKYGDVCLTTEDGTAGEQGFVTNHSVLNRRFDRIACCGPLPMMKAVAAFARQSGTDCEVSLENMMACGLGACLCCVEKTVKGNVCVCTEGPVFNINELTW